MYNIISTNNKFTTTLGSVFVKKLKNSNYSVKLPYRYNDKVIECDKNEMQKILKNILASENLSLKRLKQLSESGEYEHYVFGSNNLHLFFPKSTEKFSIICIGTPSVIHPSDAKKIKSLIKSDFPDINTIIDLYESGRNNYSTDKTYPVLSDLNESKKIATIFFGESDIPKNSEINQNQIETEVEFEVVKTSEG